MFSLKQPPVSQDILPALLDSSVPVISVTENSDALDYLLRLCYPILPPSPQSVDLLEETLSAAIKYDMELPISTLTNALGPFQDSNPLGVFALACTLNLEDIAVKAANDLRSRRQEWRDATSPNDSWESTICYQVMLNVSLLGVIFG